MPQYHTYYPNYEKLYPGIEKRPDILRVLRASDRKMRYMEWQLQTERFVEDQEKQIAVFLPSRETSLEQMNEEKRQFVDERPGPEEQLTNSEKAPTVAACPEKSYECGERGESNPSTSKT